MYIKIFILVISLIISVPSLALKKPTHTFASRKFILDPSLTIEDLFTELRSHKIPDNCTIEDYEFDDISQKVKTLKLSRYNNPKYIYPADTALILGNLDYKVGVVVNPENGTEYLAQHQKEEVRGNKLLRHYILIYIKVKEDNISNIKYYRRLNFGQINKEVQIICEEDLNLTASDTD